VDDDVRQRQREQRQCDREDATGSAELLEQPRHAFRQGHAFHGNGRKKTLVERPVRGLG
jgi:hypothetical protein